MSSPKVGAASLLLIVGVALVGATVETGALWPSFLGYLALVFVPALIVDAAVGEIERRGR